MKCEEKYLEIYCALPKNKVFCPYRISPLGAHIDHQYGKINGLAIDKGIHIAYSRKENGVVELQSLNFPKRAQFHVASIPEEKVGGLGGSLQRRGKDAGREVSAALWYQRCDRRHAADWGLSSSASVIIAFLSALASVNGIKLEPWETIMMAKAAENKYVGVNCGKLDQSCEVLCKKDQLLYLDCADDSYSLIPWIGPKFTITQAH